MSKAMRCLLAVLSVLLLAGMLVTGCASGGSTTADFYKGKTVTFIVGYAPGGSNDLWTRAMAPQIAKFTGANVIVENQAGAGGNLALNNLYNTVTPDGLTIALGPAAAPAAGTLVGDAGIKYDMRKFIWLGTPSYSTMVLAVGVNGPYQTIEAMQKAPKPVKFGLNSKTTSQAQETATFCHDMKIKPQMVVGYAGTADIAVAAIRGEVDAYVSTTDEIGATDPTKVKYICSFSRERSREVPSLSTFYEIAKVPPEGTPWMDLRQEIVKLGRAIIASPNTPPDRVEYLRQAVKKGVEDPEFVKSTKARNMAIDFRTAEDQAKMVEKILSLPKDKVDQLKYILLEEFYPK